jgi:hypothetical protein
VDYTIFWRRLSDHVAGGDVETVRDLFGRPGQPSTSGCYQFSERLTLESAGLAAD